jgi:hypothetical protein
MAVERASVRRDRLIKKTLKKGETLKPIEETTAEQATEAADSEK